MRRAWKISDASQRAELLIQRTASSSSPKPKTLKPLYYFHTSLKPTTPFFRFFLVRGFCSSQIDNPSSSSWPNNLGFLVGLFDKSADSRLKEELTVKISRLKYELIKCIGDSDSVNRLLEEKGLPLFTEHLDGSAFILLMEQLRKYPQLAVEVFRWRRKHAGFKFGITREEYAKGITVAGRAKNVDLAYELFKEAAGNCIKTASIYNALMGAYMYNGLSEKCQSLFQDFKKDRNCRPTIVTYHILLTVFGRLMLIDHMEATLQQIYDSNLYPNKNTFNYLIAGYVTAWMWDRMENTYRTMNEMSIKPDVTTYLLMVRGYAHAGKLKKMEAMYELARRVVEWDDVYIIRCMICAYCKSSHANKIEKIEEWMKRIPEGNYSPWMNVLLIKAYAQADMLDKMEKFIDVAFEHDTAITTISIMRSIITAYYRLDAIDRLVGFVQRAEYAGWRICRSLYHCKMVMYGSQNRLEEMEMVLAEMEKFNLDITKKTLVIMCKAYSDWGARCKLEQVAGLMCKQGFGLPLALPAIR